jgi:protein-S-isoprenylcysteine O-methyltransferase Ste14
VKEDLSERPNSVPWPPIVLAVSIAIAIALGYLVPMSIPRNMAVGSAGYLAVAVGTGLDVWAVVMLKRAGTNILPHRGATRLVSRGPFGFTRTPITSVTQS